MPRGTDGNTANSRTTPTEPKVEATQQLIVNGRALTATELDTLGHSSRLSDEDQWEVTRLRTIRKRGQMLTMGECDWLLDLAERMGR
jgi:hypothetical protein